VFVSTLFASDPFAGRWELNTASSSGVFPKDETVVIHEASGKLKVWVIITPSDPSDPPITIRYQAPANGGEGRIEEGPYESVSLRRTTKNMIEVTYVRGKEVRVYARQRHEERQGHDIRRERRGFGGQTPSHGSWYLKRSSWPTAAGLQHDLDEKGIAKTAREEKIRQRDEKLKQAAENARMAKLYREQILKEPKAPEGFVPLGTIAPAKKEVREEVGSFGD